jgi:hypothetical protein
MRKNEIDTTTGKMKTPPLQRSPHPTNRLQQIAIVPIKAQAPIGMRSRQAARL